MRLGGVSQKLALLHQGYAIVSPLIAVPLRTSGFPPPDLTTTPIDFGYSLAKCDSNYASCDDGFGGGTRAKNGRKAFGMFRQ